MSVTVLAKRWLTAKARIKELQEELGDIELDLLTVAGVEFVIGGSKTTHSDGFKITVKCPINRTIDGEAWETIKDQIPADMRPVRVKVEPDAKGCEWLRENDPKLWAICARAITEREGKPRFTIEEEEPTAGGAP